jgi:hypothetical protein
MARRLSSDPMAREKSGVPAIFFCAGRKQLADFSQIMPLSTDAVKNLVVVIFLVHDSLRSRLMATVDFGHCPVHHKWPHQINASVFICGALP